MIILGVGLTVLVILIIGLAVAKKIDGDSANYLVAGRSLGVPLVAVSLTAAAVDANATVGNTDLTADFGFWAGAALPIGLAICLVVIGIFLAKPINQMKLMTIADYFRLRYNRATELTGSALLVVTFTILLAGNLVACGYLLERFANVPYAWGIIISTALIVSYTMAGGLVSSAYTAMVQMVITVIATVALLGWVLATYGIILPEGMGPFDFEQLTSADYGAPINWGTLIALGIGDIVAIDLMQRVIAAKSPETARRSCFAGAALTATIGVIFSLVAVTAVAVYDLNPADGPVLYTFMYDSAPVLIAVLVLSGIVAASFSTASGALLSTSSVTVRNIFGVKRQPHTAGPDPLLRWTRIAMVPVFVAGAFFAIQVAQTASLLVLAFDLMLSSLAAPLLIGMYWRRPGVVATLSAIAVGFVLRMVFLVLTPTLYGLPNDILYIENPWFGEGFDGWATIIPGAAGFAVFVAVALISPRKPEELESEKAVLAELEAEREGEKRDLFAKV
ncbi:high affinity choline transporter 1 [Nesterenkonia populi]